MILRNLISPLTKIFQKRTILAANFSTYFEEKDRQEIQSMSGDRFPYKPYQKMVDMWKKPLEKKRLRQARIKEIKATKKVNSHSSLGS